MDPSPSENTSRNVSGEKRAEIVSRLEKIELFIQGAPQDENTKTLLGYIAGLKKDLRAKKYGLVFEEHREKIDDDLEKNTPVLTEDKGLFLNDGGQINFLIEGDNLASLQLLERTHKGKIDLIYIDPPYNTGNRDFVYGDKLVDKTDMFRHSKWLSFMSKRLKYAQKLLSEKGLIFMSINNIEGSQLKILSDTIFGEANYVTTLIWKCRASLYYTEPLFSEVTENILVYAKDKSQFWLKSFDKESLEEDKKLEGFFLKRVRKKYDGEDYVNLDNDPNGPYKTSGKVRNDGRPSYTVVSPTGVSHTQPWVYTPEVFRKLDKLGRIYWGVDGAAQPRKKSYLKDFIGNVSSNLLSDEFVKTIAENGKTKKEKYFEIGTTESGTKEVKSILGDSAQFDYPKPTTLIKYLIERYPKDDVTVLDFFAGSGTTGHAVMRLNKEDGGKRRFILCTNNESDICRKVTYERIKHVIKKEKYEASLKYFRVEFVPLTERVFHEYAYEILMHIRELVELENAINFTGNTRIAIILKDEELDAFAATLSEKSECEIIYLAHGVLASTEQQKLFNRLNIKVNQIPDYYFGDLVNS